MEETTPETNKQLPRFTRDVVYFIIIILLTALCGQFWYTYKYKPAQERDVRIYYNQDQQANIEVTRTIQDAEKFVYFAIYTFTRDDIRDALLAAKYRGLEVRGIIDKNQSKAIDSQKAIVKELQDAGIDVVFNDHSYIMHLKTVVTDKGWVSGSYNWTTAATNLNDEIIEVGNDEDLRKQYEDTIRKIIDHYKQIEDINTKF